MNLASLITNLGKIFLEGANPLLDLTLDMTNAQIFKKGFKQTFKAKGLYDKKDSMMLKHGSHFDEKNDIEV